MKKMAILGLGGLLLAICLFPSRLSSDAPPRDAEFVYARIRYHLTPEAVYVREVPWHHDYNFSDVQFPSVVSEVTNIKTSATAYQIVDIDSPDLASVLSWREKPPVGDQSIVRRNSRAVSESAATWPGPCIEKFDAVRSTSNR